MRYRILLALALGFTAAGAASPAFAGLPARRSTPWGCVVQDTVTDEDCRRANPGPFVEPDTMVSPQGPVSDILPYTYAQLKYGPLALYASPAAAERHAAPVRVLAKGFVFVRVVGESLYNGQLWYQADGGGYLPASAVWIYPPSGFHGLKIGGQLTHPFAWVLGLVQTAAEPGRAPDANSLSLKRYDRVVIYERREVQGQVWYRVGDDRWLLQTAVAKVEMSPHPSGVGPADRWIDVNLFEQTVMAYQGDRMEYATLASTGLDKWPTIQGLYRIYYKVSLGPMSGQENKPDYYWLEGVPWTMYFYEGYSLHGAYWHDGFGLPHSHGCVNLAPIDAKWLYEWTSPTVSANLWGAFAPSSAPGTFVWVHE